MAGADPFDELGVDPEASEEEIARAYRRRVVERHRRGVWDIGDQLRRAQRAFRALSDPAARERYRRERERRSNARPTLEERQLETLRGYKSRIERDLARIGAENAARYADELQEIERQITLEEARAQALLRRRRLASTVKKALLLALLVALAVLVIRSRGG